MRKLDIKWIAMVGGIFFSFVAQAQDTNYYLPPPPTRLEAVETNTGRVIIKSIARIGSIPVDAAEVSVTCKQDIDTATGQKEFGLVISIEVNNRLEDRVTVDYDELDSILNSIDYLNKIDWTTMPLASFDASYTSKGGLRLSAYSSRREGTIGFAMRTHHTGQVLTLTRDQLARFRGLIDQAKRKLDSIRTG